jgi:hypothetical protein
MTPDRIFYPLAALVAVGMIALAIVYPQGQGDRSPPPFGHEPELQIQAATDLQIRNAQIAIEAQKAAEAARVQRAAAAQAAAK